MSLLDSSKLERRHSECYGIFSSTQSYGILITSLDTDCPSTGWPVGEKAKILPKNLLVERIWHCHGMTRLRASNTKLLYDSISFNIGLYGRASSACHVLSASYVGTAHHDSYRWGLSILKTWKMIWKPQTSSCWLQGTLGSFEHPVCICSSCKYSWNTRETWNVRSS